jgi:hypothetical protein
LEEREIPVNLKLKKVSVSFSYNDQQELFLFDSLTASWILMPIMKRRETMINKSSFHLSVIHKGYYYVMGGTSNEELSENFGNIIRIKIDLIKDYRKSIRTIQGLYYNRL